MQLNKTLMQSLYGINADATKVKERYNGLKAVASQRYSITKGAFFSVAGRTELAGNHTDHNHGSVLAASINLDALGYGCATGDSVVKVYDLGYEKEFVVDLAKLDKVDSQTETTEALIRGVADYYVRHSHNVGGFTLVTHSTVIAGGGLSSSAAFEGLIAYVFNCLYNNEKLDVVAMGLASQYAENVHYGKPCGLMDQLSCLHGGVVSIDFANPQAPLIKEALVDFTKYALQLCIVDTASSHEGLTKAYASMPNEMKSVASYFGKTVLRELDETLFYSKIDDVRKTCGERATLRAIHFFEDSKRVDQMIKALNDSDINSYIKLVNESGFSSAMFLQNVLLEGKKDMAMALALALSYKILQGSGACRVHGGGFAGAIQAYVDINMFASYKEQMEAYFGHGSVQALSIRLQSACKIEDDLTCL